LQVLPAAYWDALLLARFPGKTLEELDGIDWPRLMRAWQAKEIGDVENARQLFFEDKYKPTGYEWRMILRHDRLENTGEQSE
jgi:hypothetical protein